MIDSHCHLADEAFAGDLDEVVERARAAGLSAALCILGAGDDEEAARAEGVGARARSGAVCFGGGGAEGGAARAEGVRQRWAGVRFATGVHPHTAGTYEGR